MGCAELNNQKRTWGRQNKIKETEINEVHSDSWSSRQLARASSPPSPSLNGESDGYSLHFSRAGCVFASITQPFVCAPPTVKTSDNLNVLRICFAGSLGISRQMEGLVSEVSRITEAVKDSAPSWPLVQLHRLSLAQFSLWILPDLISAMCVVMQFVVCLMACAQQSVFVNVRAAARRDTLKSPVALAMAGFTMRHCPLRSL